MLTYHSRCLSNADKSGLTASFTGQSGANDFTEHSGANDFTGQSGANNFTGHSGTNDFTGHSGANDFHFSMAWYKRHHVGTL